MRKAGSSDRCRPERNAYDELHLLYEDDEVLRQSGSRIDYSYDDFNRVIKIAYPEGGDVEYEYGAYGAANNAAGKIVSVRDEAGVTTYEYGKLGEVTKETRTLRRHIPAYENEKTAVMEYVSDYLSSKSWRFKYYDLFNTKYCPFLHCEKQSKIGSGY